MDGRCLLFKLLHALVVVFLHLSRNPASLGFTSVAGAGHGDTNIRCMEKESQALLAFKQGLEDEYNRLSSWGSPEAPTHDCCKWEGVYCDNQTGHVVKLDLGTPARPGEYPVFQPLVGKISPRLTELQQLKYLDLSYNYFSDPIPEFIGSLKNLRYLNLSSTDFGGQIPSQIGNLTHLQYLDLSWTGFGGQIPSQIGNLTHLQYLDLRANDFTNVQDLNWLPYLSSLKYLDLSFANLSNVFDWLEAVNKLPKLTSLNLVDCGLSRPPLLSTLSRLNFSESLANVSLSDNHLTFSIFHWLFNYNTSLLHLDLSDNLLNGSIPDVFSDMSSLVHLDLSGNLLNGSIPDMSSLVHLNLSGNLLNGSIPDVFSDMSSLVHLDLSDNQLEGGIPPSFANLCSLQSLRLGGNNHSGQFSEFVQILSKCGQNSLEILDLSQNHHIAGPFPDLTNFLSLKELYLDENELSGGLPESIGQMSKLERISFSKNSLKGVISETHFSKLSKLEYLDLSSNSLVLKFPYDWVPPFQLDFIRLGSCKLGPYFPKWLRTQNNFTDLNISYAGISDIIPSWFWGLSPKFSSMDLSHNQIRGKLGKLKFANYPKVNFGWNQLEGPIPSILLKASFLDLSNNKFSGLKSFLCSIKVSHLTFLNLSSNHISEELADCWTRLHKLVFLGLSNNALFGKIPSTMGSLISIKTLKLDDNKLVGELPSSLKNCTNLSFLDVGENRLSGSIPEWIGVSLPDLAILILRSNNLSGSMPAELCHLTHIQVLDLSMNNISGTIPKCLNNLKTLAQKGNSTPTITHTVASYSNRASLIGKVILHENSSLTVTTLMSGGTSFVEDYDDEASIIWKGIMSKYKSILGLLKIIDLSSNKLTGEIPSEITFLVGLVSLNISRNQLTGQIPLKIGMLQELNSLDLSKNQINGRIPTSLSQIHALGVLDLSNNKLSGQIPVGTQLQSFNSSAYAGNPQLCGPPLLMTCFPEEKGAGQPVLGNQEDKDGVIMQGFYISMGLGFAVGFWGVCGTLVLNRSCRYAYFNFVNFLGDWLYVRAAIIRRRMCNS